MSLFYQIQFFELKKIFDTFFLNFLKKKFENLLQKQINEFALSMIINDGKKNEKLTIFLARERVIDEFNFLLNEKNITKIKIDTISINFTTQSI